MWKLELSVMLVALLSLVGGAVRLGVAPHLHHSRQLDEDNRRVVRVGLLARDAGSRKSDQGFMVRRKFFSLYIHKKKYNNTLFQLSLYHCGHSRLGEEDVQCADIDILIHTQQICVSALNRCDNISHVLDYQDNYRETDKGHLISKFDGELFHTKAQAMQYCNTPFCMRFPTPFDLGICSSIVRKARVQRMREESNNFVVGLVGKTKVYGSIAQTLEMANISFIREANGRDSTHHTCEFFSKISLAIAWSPFIATDEAIRGEYWRHFKDEASLKDIDYWYLIKPAERFTNPLWLDIPTIGHAKYKSFQEFGSELLCESDSCVLDLIPRIRNGEMTKSLLKATAKVRRETDPMLSAKYMMNFFSSIMTWKQSDVALELYTSNRQQKYFNLDF